jgi:Tol biopolymer transport system component
MKTNYYLLFCLCTALIVSCSDSQPGKKAATTAEKQNTGANWTGKLVYEYTGDIAYYDFSTKKESIVFKEAGQPFVTANKQVITVRGKFPKANYVIETADPDFNNNKVLLDLSDGWFGGKIYGLKMSPDNKMIAAGITSYNGYKINTDAVVVFDLSGNIVARFDNKYQPDWTPRGELVMAGSLMSESADGKVYTNDEAGIFISSDLKTLKRIDPGFDDPAPVNVAVSADGKRVAFIKNNHVWVMNMNGSDVKQLTAAGGDNEESFPAWSPDGKYIACWTYKTFEKSYYTAIAIVPSDASQPVQLENNATVWPRDNKNDRVSGGAHQLNWVKE